MFKLIALKPLQGCRKSALKCLEEGRMYYFCNEYTITEDGIMLRDDYVRPLPEDFFSVGERSSLQINISAIVGMNGDGKSTLVELMMRLINNCAKHYRLTDKDNLLRIEGIKAELYFLMDNVVYCIRETANDNYTSLLKYADISNREVRRWKGVMRAVESVRQMNELFYTIVSNYSLYAYNTKDFKDEWSEKVKTTEECWKCWLHYLFHKNDGYRTPMTLHPYRYEGNIDINKETELTMQRLMALYIQEPSPKENVNSFRKIGDKDAEVLQLTDAGYSKLQRQTIIQHFIDVKGISTLTGLINQIKENIKKYDVKIEDDLHNDKVEMVEECLDMLTGVRDAEYKQFLDGFIEWIRKERRVYSSKSDVRQFLNALLEAKNNFGEDDLHFGRLSQKFKCYDKLNIRQLTRFRFVYKVMRCWKVLPEVLLKDYEALTDIERCQHYIVYKTIDICGTYPEYRDVLNEKDGGWNNTGLVFNDSIIDDVVGRIKEDTTHVTLKLRQCLKFIERREREGENVFEQLDGKDLPKSLKDEYTGSMLVKFDELKQYFHEDPFPLVLLPPPIYKAEILYQSRVNADEYIPYRFLSSGEKQLLNNLGALVYHLRNLESVTDDGRRYENVNVILEEIELYFHPDYQRKVVNMLLEKLYAIDFKHIKRINITFVTHSPFILSDIPLCNVLFLKNGKPAYTQMQENTFGANIHGMLKNGFFLPSLPMGEFAHEKINNLFERLNNFKLDVRNREQEEWFYSNIMRVGEPYLREQLMRLYNMHYPVGNDRY